MTITRYDPYNALACWRRDMNRRFGNGPRVVNDEFVAGERNWTPAIDIREVENGYVLRADLPGVQRDEVEITMDRNVLTIQGKREATESGHDGKVLRSERVSGNYRRRLTLPETIDRDGISATYENGVLEVTLPKAAEAQPRKIAVGE